MPPIIGLAFSPAIDLAGVVVDGGDVARLLFARSP
jgi:hypothetical protein